LHSLHHALCCDINNSEGIAFFIGLNFQISAKIYKNSKAVITQTSHCEGAQ